MTTKIKIDCPKKTNPLRIARELLKSRLSVIPVAADGSKKPLGKWKPFQSRRPTPRQTEKFFNGKPVGIAIIGGKVSGNLEVIDFDDPSLYKPWSKQVKKQKPGLLERLPVIKTPSGGRHVYYRCDKIGGNQKLAMRGPDEPEEKKVLIETRGEGGYVLAPGSHPTCHELNKPYRHESGPPLTKIVKISPEDRELLLAAARKHDRRTTAAIGPTPNVGNEGGRPGDDFNRQATWDQILIPHGWKRLGTKEDGTVDWRRPGKGEGNSATTNHKGDGMFRVFSTSVPGFEPDRGYDKFATYAILKHGGDLSAAARALVEPGYGKPTPTLCRCAFSLAIRF